MSQTKAQLIDPVDGTIVNADINASAAIAGSKISPDFGSQNIVTTGTAATGALTIDGPDTATGSGGPTALSLKQGDANDEFVNLSFQTGAGGPLGAISAVADATGVYPNTTGQLRFSTQVGSGLFERMFIKSDGKIGIGTASPDELLHLYQNATDNVVALFEQNTVNQGNLLSFKQKTTGPVTRTAYVGHGGDATGNLIFQNSGAIALQTNGNNTALTIDTSQKVGIGTTSPSLPLDVVGANNTTFDHVGTISLQGTDAYNSGNAGAGINFSGKFNSSNAVTTLAQISGIKEDTGDGTYDGALTFGVRNDAEGVNIERVRIGSNGYLGINTAGTDSTYMTHVKSSTFGLLKLETTLSGQDGAYLEMKHTSTSPADNDQLGIIQFKGKNDANEDNTYGYLMFRSLDVSDNSEDGELQVVTQNGGVAGARLTVGQDGAIKANTGNFVVGNSGRGIQFNAADSGSSEILDDYEEGVWDPAVLGFSNVEKQSTEWTGHYTKIGNLVFVEFYLRFTTGGATTSTGGHIGIDNLPFDIENVARKRGFGGTNYQNINSSSHTADNWSLYGGQGSDFANFYVGSASVTAPSGTTQAARYIIGGFTYTTAS